MQTRNDLTAAVPKFCLALEGHRRTQDGRVRTSQEFVAHFFPHDASSCSDRLFKYMPNDVRGPILAAWGIRGGKAALRDDDEKVQSVVHDALVAGDIDHAVFEDGLSSETVVRWVPLAEWWTFWRGGKLSKLAIQRALASAYELLLFDAKWFLDTIESRGGKLRGTDVLADGLTKDDLTEWVRRIHESADGSPRGVLTAIGWDKVVAKTANEVLIAVLDAMVQKAALVKSTTPEGKPPDTKPGDKSGDRPAEKSVEKPLDRATGAPPPLATATPSDGSSAPKIVDAAKSTEAAKTSPRLEKNKDADIEWNELETAKAAAEHSVENEPTISQKGDMLAGRAAPIEDGGASDDGMIVVVDEDVDISMSESAPTGRGENDPPTAPRLEAAKPVSPEETEEVPTAGSRGATAKRTVPPAPPPRPGRERSAR